MKCQCYSIIAFDVKVLGSISFLHIQQSLEMISESPENGVDTGVFSLFPPFHAKVFFPRNFG